MSDQTDIERIVEKWESYLPLSEETRKEFRSDIEKITAPVTELHAAYTQERVETSSIHQSELNQLRSQLALRVEETARLKWEVERLRNILDEGKGQSAVSMLFQENEKLRASLAEATAEIESFSTLQRNMTTRQLALGAQCQRMRDALTRLLNSIKIPSQGPPVWKVAEEALSAHLDLELLNRVSQVLTGVMSRIPNGGAWESVCPLCNEWVPHGNLKHQPDCPVNSITALLKSLSPAPNS